MLFSRGHVREIAVLFSQSEHPLVLIVGGTRLDLLSFSE
jgi:hypothetical protein